MSDNIPVTSGGAENLTKDFSVAVRVVDRCSVGDDIIT
jgi:hypothetical protein